MKNTKLLMLTECSVMLALSIVLSMVKIIRMPMGGSVTLLSMLPVMLVAVKYGLKGGLPCAFGLALYRLIEGIVSGNVFVYCTTGAMVAVCALFDYIVPFTVLGCSALFRKPAEKLRPDNRKAADALLLAGFVLVIAVRFVCHFITGFSIWGQWAPEGQSKYIYSLLYNGQYMLPECIFTTIGAAILINIPVIRKLLGIKAE
ncbi:MAG: energy-coupled thiamine transporter ThiT [Clostridia bacterium]|nr:energy-coupled thiamine transporter ThiT [Clostridia bacterium]